MANFTLQGSVTDLAGNTTSKSVVISVGSTTTMPQFGHVFIVVEENSDYSQIVGNSSMPYLNGLMTKYGLATQYYANTHPSIGNYFELTCGQILTNDDSSSVIENVPNVVRSLVAAGKTWKAYAESLPSVGYLGGDTGQYARKHNTIALYSDVANDPNGQARNLVPFTQFATDLAAGTLPSYSFIVPNLTNDLHDGTAAQADAWLKTNIDPLIQSSLFQNDGLLFIVFDESSGDNTNGGGRIVGVVVSAKVIAGSKSTTLYQHPSVLRTMMEALGLTTFPGAAATAPDMVEFFTGVINPPPPAVIASVVVTPATVSIGIGQTVQLVATAKDAAGNTISGQVFTWTSSNTAVATVNSTGLVTALTVGSATITAATSGKTGSCVVTTAVAINKFVIGDRVQTNGTANIRSAPAASGTLLGTQPAGAQGTVVGGPVVDTTGDQLIRWQINFDQGVDGWAAEAYLVKALPVVIPGPVVSVTVNPTTATIATGQTTQLTATAKDSVGNIITGQTFFWASSNSTIATVDGNGLVSALSVGSVTVTATTVGITGNCAVTTTALVTPPPTTSWVFDHFVSPSGRAGGPGTLTDPWSLAYVAAGAGGTLAADVARAAPNNHSYVAVRGGTYHITSQLNFTVDGTLGTGVDALDGKIIVRNYPGERWVITAGDGANHSFDCVRNVGNYCWLWGFELYWSTWGDRTAAPAHVTGCYQSQQSVGGSKFIHCIMHDLDNGMTAEFSTAPTTDNEYYGCIGYNNGLNNSSPGGNGHAIYVRHDTTNNAYLNIRACIAFDQYGLNYQVYDQSAGLNHLRVEDCIGFNGGMRSSSSTGGQELVCWTPNAAPHEITINRNLFFKNANDPGPILSNIGKSGDVGANIEIANNYGVSNHNGTFLQIQTTMSPQSSMSIHNNFGRTGGTIVDVAGTGTLAYDWRVNEWHRDPTGGFAPGGSFTNFKGTTGLGTTDTCVSADPTFTRVFVVPANKYEPGRAHICYYDWNNLAGTLGYIPADVSAVLTVGNTYALYDVRDLVNPVQTGTWDGTSLKLPITQLPPQPAGGTSTGPTPPQTAPFFNVFVLRTSN